MTQIALGKLTWVAFLLKITFQKQIAQFVDPSF